MTDPEMNAEQTQREITSLRDDVRELQSLKVALKNSEEALKTTGVVQTLSGLSVKDQINTMLQVLNATHGGSVDPVKMMVAMAAMFARSLSPQQRSEVIDMLLLQAESLAKTLH